MPVVEGPAGTAARVDRGGRVSAVPPGWHRAAAPRRRGRWTAVLPKRLLIRTAASVRGARVDAMHCPASLLFVGATLRRIVTFVTEERLPSVLAQATEVIQ